MSLCHLFARHNLKLLKESHSIKLKKAMAKFRKFHFVVHNQGSYDPSKKDQLLTNLRANYSHLEGYLIAQETYSHDPLDTHLQGNLFFKNALQLTSLLKFFKTHYKEQQTPRGLLYRTYLSLVEHEGRAYNYMMNPDKEGGDRDAISDNTALDKRRANNAFDKRLQELIENVLHLTIDWTKNHI